MASAERTTVTKEVVTTVEEKVIRLDLTEEEAEFIYAMTGKIGGSQQTYATLSQGIRNAIGDADVYSWHGKFFEAGSPSWLAKYVSF